MFNHFRLLKYIYLLLSCLFFPICLIAQQATFDWVNVFKSNPVSGNQEISSMVADRFGNTYMTGTFTQSVDFDPGPVELLLSSGSTDLFIIKLNATGNLVWVKQIESSGIVPKSICIDNESNICITGQFKMPTDFDPGPAVQSLSTSLGNYNTFILKLSSAGNFNWVKKLENMASYDNDGVAIDSDMFGNISVAGNFKGKVDFNPGQGEFFFTGSDEGDLYVLKLDINGNFIWAREIKRATPTAISIDEEGSICMTGLFISETDFDPGPAALNLAPIVLSDIFILKLNASGNFLWAGSAGGLSSDRGLSVTADDNKDIYVTGVFYGAGDFDPGPSVYNLSSPVPNIVATFILKISKHGEFIWARSIGGGIETYGKGITTDNQHNCYITGLFWGIADFDPGPPVFNLIAESSYNTYILKLNANGNFIWAKNLYGGLNQGLSIAADSARNIYTTGRYFQIVDFNPGPDMYNLTSGENPNGYMLKLKQPCTANTSSSIQLSSCNPIIVNGQLFTGSGRFTQVISNNAGCDSIITLNLDIGKKYSTTDTAICEGQSILAGGGLQTNPGSYTDSMQTIAGCDSIVITRLTVHPNPIPDLGVNRRICAGSFLQITPGVFDKYLWQDLSTASSFTINDTGTYWVAVTNSNNCTAIDSLVVNGFDSIPQHFLPPDNWLCTGAAFNIDIPGYKNYLWNSGDTNHYLTIRQPGVYWLNVSDFNECKGADTIRVIHKPDCLPISVPNAFTPNGDGVNDIFRPIITQETTDYRFEIFNRYGQKVFSTSIYPAGWDGTLNGKKQPAAVYIYYISYQAGNGFITKEKGTVWLIR